MDLGKKESQIAIITEAGELVEKRMRTERERLMRYFKDRPRSRILMEASTGDITKAGNSRMRWLLVEAAWRLATHRKRPETQALREWAERIARRRGLRVAVVALARKLSRILYAMWRDGSVYQPAMLKGALHSKVVRVA